MADLWDAVDYEALSTLAGAKAGYIDGPKSAWPAEAWRMYAHDSLIHITVLGDEAGEAFDGEAGNAGPGTVAQGISNRISAGHWAWLYANEGDMPSYLQALRTKGIAPLDRQFWPKPGLYLWCADPSGNIAAGRWHPPVDPVAVQDAWHGTYDHSTLYVELPAPAPEPAPTPVPTPAPPEVIVNVILPELAQGAQGASVAAVQKLLGGLAVDGVFGPLTHDAVIHFQAEHALTQDGIVGAHTWGNLLGWPQ